jgi:hypothetical protein
MTPESKAAPGEGTLTIEEEEEEEEEEVFWGGLLALPSVAPV